MRSPVMVFPAFERVISWVGKLRFGLHGEHVVHRVSDLQPRSSDGRGEHVDLDALGHRIGVAAVVDRAVDEHPHVVDHGDRRVDHRVLLAEEAQGEGRDRDLVARLDDGDREPGRGIRDALGAKMRMSGALSSRRVSCSGVQWSACSWVITTATAPEASVIAVVNDPGSTKSFFPDCSMMRAACSSFVSLISPA